MRTVSVEDFSRQMSAEPLSVVDIRPFEDYQDWHIAGKNVYARHLGGTSVLQDAAKLSPLDADVPWVRLRPRRNGRSRGRSDGPGGL